jgi:GMP synthase (glutamine-hydrolysing)
MKLLIVNNAEKGIRAFTEPLETILREAGTAVDTVEYEEAPTTDRSQYAGIILSGSPCGDDIVDHHLPYFQWISTIDKPLLGICAGHHIMGKLFGARLQRSVEKEVGDFYITIDQQDPLFAGFPKRFLVRQAHHDSISLPPDFNLLAHSEQCRVEVMKHHRLPLYSSQFHPEILNPRMILNFATIAASSPDACRGPA